MFDELTDLPEGAARAGEAMPQLLDAVGAGEPPDAADDASTRASGARGALVDALCFGRVRYDEYGVDPDDVAHGEQRRARARAALLRALARGKRRHAAAARFRRSKRPRNVSMLRAPGPSRFVPSFERSRRWAPPTRRRPSESWCR